jgi:type I restriction enzyme S subunit
MENLKYPRLRFRGFSGDWLTTRVGTLGQFVGGGTPSSKHPEYWKGDIPWISSSDINQDSIFDICVTRHITEEAVSNSATRVVPARSVLVVSRVGVGKVAVNEEELCTSQDFTNIIPSHADYIFLAYLIKMNTGKLLGLNQGTSIKGFVKSALEGLELPIPSAGEQQKIAAFLTAVDDKIQQLSKKKALLEKYKKGMMQQIFNQEIRFKDENGVEYPEWEETALRNVCKINPNGSHLPDRFIYIDLESVVRGSLIKENSIKRDDAPSRAQRVLEPGDILFQMVRPYQGNNLFFDRTGDYVASTGYAQLRTMLCARYIYHYLHNQDFVNDVIAKCTGTSYPAISSENLSQIQIMIPNIAEQTKIANFLSSLDDKIKHVDQQVELTKQYKKGLLQQMFV